MLVRLFERLHPADWQRKILPVVWGVASIAALGALVARRAGRTAALFCVLLLIAAPFHVRYSQELRPYALSLFLLCLSLWLLDRFLDRPGPTALVALYLACLATAYTLYLAAVVLALAAAFLVFEDAFGREPRRARSARRFLLWSPAFVAALFLGYVPWWPVVLDVSRRAPVTQRNPLTLERLGHVLSFFAFAPDEGFPLGLAGVGYVLLVAVGLAIATQTRRLRFLLFWSVGGLAAIEVLSQIHPHYDQTRRFLPAGIALTIAAALALTALWRNVRLRPLAAILLAATLAAEFGGLVVYFREGRPDWRKLSAFFLAQARPGEKIFSENQYTQLCLGLYMRAHDRGARGARDDIPVLNLDGEIVRLTWSWQPGTRAWLVLAGEPHHAKLRRWAEPFVSFSVPLAEGAEVRRLDSNLRDRAFQRVPP